ncbi:gustatory and pheromone receptor 32a-like isoform X2 [Choristoneura fumiferana]
MTWTLILGWLVMLIGGYSILGCINKSGVWATVSVILPEMVPSGLVGFYNVMGLMVASLLKNIEHQCGTLADNDKLSNIGFVRVKPKRFRNTVSQLELAYKKTLEIKREINTAFQAILMIVTLQAFHTVLTECHELYRGLIKTGTFKVINIIYSLHWIIYQTLKMYAISFPGTVIENEENKIGQTLLRIPTESMQMIAEVQHFSSLMFYQETQMTAYGYFALDATLVFNTFVAVATYLVILVQFDS